MSETAPNRLYSVARRAFAMRQLSWLDDVFWLALYSAAYTPDTINDVLYSDIAPEARLFDTGPIGFREVDNEGYCLGGPISVNAVTTVTQATQMMIYRKDPLVLANQIPILLITQMGGLPVQFSRDFFRLDFGTATGTTFDRRMFRG